MSELVTRQEQRSLTPAQVFRHVPRLDPSEIVARYILSRTRAQVCRI